MPRLSILLFLSLFLISSLSGTPNTLTLEEVRSQYLAYVNQYRNDRGLEALIPEYSYVAQTHANQQALMDQYLAHKGFNTRAEQILTLIKNDIRSQESSFGFISIAENCCYFNICLDPAKKAFEKFVASRTHRMNLLKKYQYTAIGIAQGESGRFYFCQIFF